MVSQPTASYTQETQATKTPSAVRVMPQAIGMNSLRRNSSLPQQSVFTGGRAARKQKMSLIKAAADPSKEPRHFTKSSIRRKAELAGRALADLAPDIAALPGGLSRPSDGPSVPRPEFLRKSSMAIESENGNDRTPLPYKSPYQPPENSKQPLEKQLHVSEMPWEDVQHIPYEQRTICYFYSQPPGCHSGDCKYLHVNDSRLQIAPPPDGWIDTQKICRYFKSNGQCRNGDACNYLHESDGNLLAEKPPLRWAASKPSQKPTSSKNQLSENGDGPKMICYFWYHEQCNRGNSCKLAHSNDNDLPVAPQPQPNSILYCRYWRSGSCRNGHTCTFIHEPAQDDRAAVYNSHTDTDVTEFEFQSIQSSPLLLQNLKSDPSSGDNDKMDFEMDAMSDPSPLESTFSDPDSLTSEFNSTEAVILINTQIKIVTIAHEVHPINLDFTSLPPETSDWTTAFVSTKSIRFDQMCTALDFRLRYGHIHQMEHWQHNIDTSTTAQAESDIINRVVEDLLTRMAGLVCISESYVVLLYPASAKDWKFIDVQSNLSTDPVLKYLVFGSQCVPNVVQSLAIDENLSKAYSYENIMMKRFHHLDYDNLKLEQKDKPVDFCLIFPESASCIAESITSWLHGFPQTSTIYNYREPGAWNRFKKHSKAGVVLIHWSAIGLLSDADLLRDMKVEGTYSFWCIEDAKSILPFSFNSHYKLAKPEQGKIVSRQLLPLGYAILLTPSFLVTEPVMTHNFLKWYRNKLQTAMTGTYKLLCCYELPNFLLELFISKAAEQEEFIKNHHGDPLLLSKLESKGLSHNHCQARLDAYWLLCDILRKYLSPYDNDPSLETLQSPLLFAPSSIDQHDEKELICWFAAWAYCNLDKYKKFLAIGSGRSKGRSDRTTVMIPESDSCPPNSEAFRMGGTLAWSRRGRSLHVTSQSTEQLSPELAISADPSMDEVKMKEYRYPVTSVWFDDWKKTAAAGQSMNHIMVGRWESILMSLDSNHFKRFLINQ